MPLDLQPATDRLAAIVAGLSDDQLGLPTPCERYSLGDLLDHVNGLSLAFTCAAAKDLSSLPPDMRAPSGDASRLPDDWQRSIPVALADLAAAWRAPDAWEGMTQAGGIDLPGEVAGLVALGEVTVHAWDLSVATGGSYSGEPVLLDAVHDFIAGFEPVEGDGPAEGLFGPPVPVPADAPVLDKILGLTGRNPTWRP